MFGFILDSTVWRSPYSGECYTLVRFFAENETDPTELLIRGEHDYNPDALYYIRRDRFRVPDSTDVYKLTFADDNAD